MFTLDSGFIQFVRDYICREVCTRVFSVELIILHLQAYHFLFHLYCTTLDKKNIFYVEVLLILRGHSLIT